MLFVAKHDGTVGAITDLSSNEMAKLVKLGTAVEQTYETVTDANDPIALELLAVNYHPNPLPESNAFGRKLHAQTLADLHSGGTKTPRRPSGCF